mmetsp:Transcript_2910/g.3251  ORF Transcript_2910/g.3251 Transcript_2910/m.3251 type:complete len:119 (-) Transcript_2910:60-416(-)|eukprot:CAMPEP_0168536842 /NCGR_PEP_ID=MMETSP0405-20121227/19864_1 /TAXON_ID=498012 /ORGANISM="Trichosphaerium sp, Strain Am-I-7 wt" /LENGTH=118 /DNA_ID=CAMNT_0008565073 /DNA_START=530 /DNA_END=886 /DNA_ORIENTATION=+
MVADSPPKKKIPQSLSAPDSLKEAAKFPVDFDKEFNIDTASYFKLELDFDTYTGLRLPESKRPVSPEGELLDSDRHNLSQSFDSLSVKDDNMTDEHSSSDGRESLSRSAGLFSWDKRV